MECNKDEALKAKEIAERKFESNDLHGAKIFALKAQALFPGLEGIVQMITTFVIYLASEVKIAGEKDWYSILSVDTSAGEDTLKMQYRKLALLLHPDKNKSVGAEGAFQMVKEAWTVLSDKTKRLLFDQKRKQVVFQQKISQSNKARAVHGSANGFDGFVAKAAASKARSNKQKNGSAISAVRRLPPLSHQAPSAPARASALPHTFWTSCTKCNIHFEYIKLYLNQTLRCPICSAPFLAKEEAGPSTEIVHTVKDPNIGDANQDDTGRIFQWGPFSRTAGAASATASSADAAIAASVVHQTYEIVKRQREEAQAAVRREDALQEQYNPLKRQSTISETVNLGTANVASGKKMRSMGKDVGVGFSSIISGAEANSFRMPSGSIPFSTNSGAYESQGVNGGSNWKPRPPTRIRSSKAISKLDRKRILVDKMKSVLREKILQKKRKGLMEKLKGIRSKTVKVAGNGKASISKKHVVKEHVEGRDDCGVSRDAPVDPEGNCSGNTTDAKNEDGVPFSYTVPDPHFYDFDKDRTENSFQSNQIWASYDDEDGMPRYYAFIQEYLSLTPFKLKISFLTSRTNSEFGSSNWVSSGFRKTCGDFRIGRYETCDVLNMFSHQIKWEKGPRGIIKCYPHKGDIWAVYRNWSPEWNADTPDNVVRLYDLVEILEDYDEDYGISVIPLIKVAGFRTVFQRHQDLNFIKRIPKEEIFQLSHQVPFYRISGEEAPNVPRDSYEIDPAALSKELLQEITETVQGKDKSGEEAPNAPRDSNDLDPAAMPKELQGKTEIVKEAKAMPEC